MTSFRSSFRSGRCAANSPTRRQILSEALSERWIHSRLLQQPGWTAFFPARGVPLRIHPGLDKKKLPITGKCPRDWDALDRGLPAIRRVGTLRSKKSLIFLRSACPWLRQRARVWYCVLGRKDRSVRAVRAHLSVVQRGSDTAPLAAVEEEERLAAC